MGTTVESKGKEEVGEAKNVMEIFQKKDVGGWIVMAKQYTPNELVVLVSSQPLCPTGSRKE